MLANFTHAAFHRSHRSGHQACAFPAAAAALALLAGLWLAHPAAATHGPAPQPWAGTPTPVVPGVDPTLPLPTPREVTGKDFSDGRDRDFENVPSQEQVVAWDGIGGVRNSFNYQGSRAAAGFPFPEGQPRDREVDGIANGGDSLFHALRDNQAGLLFSVQGDGNIYYVQPTGFPGASPAHGIWAIPSDLDAVHPPSDVDGLEVWGPDQLDDTDRYSLRGDPAALHPDGTLRRVAIWEYAVASHHSIPHTYTSDLAAAIDMQFGGPGGGELFSLLLELMDVDAIMTLGSRVIFSIDELDLTGFDPALPNFHGGEIFVYDGLGGATTFLTMGGHTFDSNLDLVATFGVPSNNINAIEAIGVPEPAALTLLGLGALLMIRRRP